MDPVPFAVNARPLLGAVTGIGRYVSALMAEIGRDGRFAPHYFYATRWSPQLLAPSSGTVPPAAIRLLRSLRPLHAVARAVQQRRFTDGIRARRFAFYFEPNFLPFRSDLPNVITVHDLSHLRFPQTHPAARVRQLAKELPGAVARARRILTPSEFTRREVIDAFGADPARVVATPLGVEARFRPRGPDATGAYLRPLGLDHGRYFLAVGTLEPRKNLLTTLAAHARLPAGVRERYPLAVAGVRGWLSDEITRRIEAARAHGSVRLLGHVGDADLPLLYAGAAMLCYPSLYEGFGLPPLEAMASGVPVAVSDRASLPEVVGDAGVLVAPEDVDGLAQAMARVVDDPAFAADRAARGCARAAEYTWARCAALTAACFADLARAAENA